MSALLPPITIGQNLIKGCEKTTCFHRAIDYKYVLVGLIIHLRLVLQEN